MGRALSITNAIGGVVQLGPACKMDDATSSCSSSSGYQSADGKIPPPQKQTCQQNGDPAEDFVIVDRAEGQSPPRFPRRWWTSSIPRVRFSTSRTEEAVDIAMGESGLAAAEPLTVGEMMQRTVVRVPHHVALRYKIRGGGDGAGCWRDVTYRDYYLQCLSAAKSFLKVNRQLLAVPACCWCVVVDVC